MSGRVRSLLLALVMVLSVVAGAGAGVTVTAATQSAAPSDMVGVPSANVQDERPGDARGTLGPADLRPQASQHADTTEVSIVTESQASAVVNGKELPEVAASNVCSNGQGNSAIDCSTDTSAALVISDDTHHEGRQVAVRAEPLRNELGHAPSFITVRNAETGEEWQTPVSQEDGWYIIDVEHFSSNTVSFSGEVSHSFSPASDGSGTQYELSDLDAANNFTIDAEGVVSEEWENQSASGASLSSSTDFDLYGDMAPVGPGGGSPVLSVTANTGLETYNPVDDEGDGNLENGGPGVGSHDSGTFPGWDAKVVPSTSGSLQDLQFNVVSTTGNHYDFSVPIYLTEEGPDDDHSEGTQIGTWDPSWSTGSQSVSLSENPTLEEGKTYTISVGDTSSGTNDNDNVRVGVDESATSTWLVDGDSTESSYVDQQLTLQTSVESLSASTDDGGSASFGDLSDGETASETIDLSTGSTGLDWSGSGGGTIDYSLSVQERTSTPDFGVEVNGNWANSSALGSGETASLTTDESWLQEGTNTVDVSIDDSGLSNEAPDPKVALDYSHDALDKRTTTYASDQWVDRYNVTRQYASDRDAASMTIPFDNTVYTLNSLEYRIDEGTWYDVDDADYQLNGNDLEVDLASVYGGTIPANTQLDLRTDASKVDPVDVTIEVLNATDAGSTLDSKIAVDAAGENPRIEVGGTDGGSFAHYVFDATWNSDEYSVIDSDGSQQLHIPGTSAGNTFRVTHADTEVVPSSGDVEVSVESAGAQPVFDVAPGPNGENTDVDFTHHRTTSGIEYVLNSITNGIAHDSATAQSPVTLEDDDSKETLEIIEEDGSSTPVPPGADSGSTGIGQFEVPDPGPNWPLIILAVSLALAALAIVQVRTGMNPITSTASSVGDAGSMLAGRPRALAVVLVLGFAAALYTGVINVGDAVLVPLTVAGVAVGAFVGLQRMDRFSMPIYGLIVGVAAFATLAATGQLASIVDALGPMVFIVLIGLLYLGYQYIQNRGQDQQINFNLRSE